MFLSFFSQNSSKRVRDAASAFLGMGAYFRAAMSLLAIDDMRPDQCSLITVFIECLSNTNREWKQFEKLVALHLCFKLSGPSEENNMVSNHFAPRFPSIFYPDDSYFFNGCRVSRSHCTERRLGNLAGTFIRQWSSCQITPSNMLASNKVAIIRIDWFLLYY